MNEVAISFGSIALLSFIMYFVIKNAVKSGINQSMLFSDKQRQEQKSKEVEVFNNAMKNGNKD